MGVYQPLRECRTELTVTTSHRIFVHHDPSKGSPSLHQAARHGREEHAQSLPQEHGRSHEETKNPSPCLNPNSKRGGMATHAGVALELGISRPHGSGAKMMSPQMEAILIWCQCRTREYDNVKIENFTNSWAS